MFLGFCEGNSPLINRYLARFLKFVSRNKLGQKLTLNYTKSCAIFLIIYIKFGQNLNRKIKIEKRVDR